MIADEFLGILLTLLVTGGAGFIGANFVLDWLDASDEIVVNVDKLTYAGNLKSLDRVSSDPRYVFVRADILDADVIGSLIDQYSPRAIVHFAAESHVDRSIHGPGNFVQTNSVGTFTLLEASRKYWAGLSGKASDSFRFINISTDEVYGSLEPEDPPFDESCAYAPNSPYSASKAAGDHFARSYFHTFGLPVITTNCSNNYGPFQFPEKLIPLLIANALGGRKLPIYGDGLNVRDWLYVGDHCAALRAVLERGRPGATYNIGGGNELTNVDVVTQLCTLLDETLARQEKDSCTKLIEFVEDRPGHDRRYAIDASRIQRELGWTPAESFENGLRKTLQWYLNNASWVADVQSGEYQRWVQVNYENRVGAK